MQAVVDYFMVSDLLAMTSPTGESPADQMASNLLGYKVGERPEAARRATPITHVHRDAPPFLVLHGDADPMVPQAQSEAFHTALSNVGADSQFVSVPGAIHDDAAFWTDQTLNEVRAFLDRTLKHQR